ncbi:hypothetical protein DFH09DRAFT_1359215 [Mycena vulgaris]|nr:hypothetical protein DFH09DRAFT_1359215 [Mycena vulgaris]
MSNVVATPPDTHEQVDRDELASAKLWAAYISEAEKYDKALVERWRSDMDGLLIFAGLFSASLTAFIIESYKTLSPDQGAITNALLAQISRQLDPHLNASSADVATLKAFSPTSSSLACNILWFLSLGLSLSCALIATLVEQWSRDFIQRTEMRPSSIIRARIFSYLYFGIKRFGMHSMVACIPLLLHISLLLFFAGLVAFLQPVNTILMTTAAVLLGLMSSTYTYLTLLPMFSSDSPYQTPLSIVAWGLFRRFWTQFYIPLRSSSDEESTTASGVAHIPHRSAPTMVEVMTRDAVRKSSERDKRDARAMVWTVRSLTDNDDLEPVLEALPDLIWGPNERRWGYDDMINMLLETPDIHLVSRTEDLLRSCDSGLLPPALETHRRTICIKALWSIAYFVASDVSTRHIFPVFDHKILGVHWQLDDTAQLPSVNSYLISAHALVRWCGFCSVSALIRTLRPDGNTIVDHDLRLRLKMIQTRAIQYGFPKFSASIARLISDDGPLDTSVVNDVLRSFGYTVYDILEEYLRHSAMLADRPYEFEPTCAIIQQIRDDVPPPNQRVQDDLKTTFILIIGFLDTHKKFPKDPGVHHIDIIVDTILHLIQTSEYSESLDPIFTDALGSYLPARTEMWKHIFGRCDPKWLGTLLTKNLAPGRRSIDKTMIIIWSLCAHGKLAYFSEETLAAVSSPPHCDFSAALYVISALKSHILTAAAESPRNDLEDLMDRLGIPNTPSTTTTERWEDGHAVILFQFLEQYSTGVYDESNSTQMIATVQFLARSRPSDRISLSLQKQFATWFTNLLESGSHPDIIKTLVSSKNPVPLNAEAFNDPITRSTIRTALIKYKATVTGVDVDSYSFTSRIIIDTLLIQLNSGGNESSIAWTATDIGLNSPAPGQHPNGSGQPSTSTLTDVGND